jgi:hypothetical protein
MEKVYGIHLGLVISDTQDPNGKNGCQIFFPHLSNAMLSLLNEKSTDLKFKDPKDLYSKDPTFIDHLKTVLPWAECAAPIFGGSSGLWNSSTSQTAINSGSTVSPYNNADVTKQYPNSSNNMNLDGTKPATASPVSGSSRTLTATKYSFGPSVGGPDTSGSDDTNTNKGIGAIGEQKIILGPGAAASNEYPLGTVLLNASTGEKMVVVDRPRSDIKGTVDVWQDPSLYNNAPTGPSDFQVVGNVDTAKLSDNASLQAAIADLPGKIVAGESASYWLNQGTAAIASASGSGFAPSTESKNAKMVMIPDRSRALAKASNIGLPGSPVGTFSTPNAGSKVWAFFLGGDVQRPVYFAQAVNSSDIAALNT